MKVKGSSKMSGTDKFVIALNSTMLSILLCMIIYAMWSQGVFGYKVEYDVTMNTPEEYRIRVYVRKNVSIIYSEYPIGSIRNVDSFKVECDRRIAVAIRNWEKQ